MGAPGQGHIARLFTTWTFIEMTQVRFTLTMMTIRRFSKQTREVCLERKHRAGHGHLQALFITARFSRLSLSTTRNSDGCLSTCARDIHFIRAGITLPTVTFTETLMIATVQCFPTHILTRWTITITTLPLVREYRLVSSTRWRLKCYFAFTRMLPTSTHPCTLDFTEEFLTAWNRFFFGTTSTTFGNHLSTLMKRRSSLSQSHFPSSYQFTVAGMASIQAMMEATVQFSIACITTRWHVFRTGKILVLYAKRIIIDYPRISPVMSKTICSFFPSLHQEFILLLLPHGHVRRPCRGHAPQSPRWQIRLHGWIWQFSNRLHG